MTDIKDKKNNTIPLEVFLDNIEIKCDDLNGTIYNFTYNINYNSNILVYTSQDIIKKPYNLTWYFFYNNENLTYLNEIYMTKVIVECSPADSIIQLKNVQFVNGSQFYFNDDFKITIYLKDQFGNYINKNDNIIVNVELKNENKENPCEFRASDPHLPYIIISDCSADYTGLFNLGLSIQNGNNYAYFCCKIKI